MSRKILMITAIMIFALGFVSGKALGAFQGKKNHVTEATWYHEEDSDVIVVDGETEKDVMTEPAETSVENVEIGAESLHFPNQESYRISPFRVIEQYPQLPTGCEITALAMVLNYYGYHVNKMDLAMNYLPTVDANFYETVDGLLIGPDMIHYFVGDPTSEGYTCGNQAIAYAANSYLNDVAGEHTAVAYSGVKPEMLYEYVKEDTPVVVWVTINMEDREETQGWYLEDGSYVEWSENDHGAVLIGYDEDTVTIADPIYDIIICPRKQFERIFRERGSQCVVLEV